MVGPLNIIVVAVVMTNEKDKRKTNISNFATYSVKRHSHGRKSASFKLKPVCLPRSRCFIAPRSWCCCDDESDTQNKNKYLHLTTILFCPRSIMFYLYICLGQAAMSTLQGKIILSIKGSHDVYQEFILLLQTDSKLLLWLSDIWRCTFVTNSNFSFYIHITHYNNLTPYLRGLVTMLFVKTKKEGQKTCPNVLNQHHYHRPTPLKICTFQLCHTKNSSDPHKFGFSHLWTFCWSKLIIIIQLYIGQN